ncbi:hypothetical protein L9F63_021561 [Diploptera punctata]|uniref:Uncharacterized protein n=1 Tax=Diploptera punctata TaxID=6984 RepID=A0AAD7ZNP2_DIPPU|nr:hypothetical protein L9F63_021561 [Diploptera punctata]
MEQNINIEAGHCPCAQPPEAEIKCPTDTFPKILYYQYHPPHHYVKGFDIIPLYHKEWREENEIRNLSFLNNPCLADKWDRFKRGLPLAEKRIINIPHPRDFHFQNYYTRYLRPEVTASYRKKLKPGPLLVDDVQCPIPGDHLHRYRECY